MTEEELDSMISEVISSALQSNVRPGENLSRANHERWNSLKHIEIILLLESALNIRFSEDEIANISCVEDIKSRILAKHAT